MKNNPNVMRTHSIIGNSLAVLLLVGVASPVQAANKMWDGGGQDNNWLTGPNWDANAAPIPGDSLFFTGTTRLSNTNNFPAGTAFNGITFNSPAGAFTLRGSSISLGGDITDNQVVVTETIGLALTLTADRGVNVVNDASLNISGTISGGFGLTKTGAGILTLSGDNTFGGPVKIQAGTLSIASDGNLGAAPGAPAPASLVLNGGALRTTANVTLNANRGIALGPTVGSGAGRIEVNSGTTLTYNGIIANNGGTGGLTKSGPGTLTLSSANTYAGPTSNRVGNLVLDFTQTGSPANNIISSSSALSMGGENTGVGIVNNIQLTMNGKPAVVNNQTFNGTSFDVGHSVIRANSGAGGTANLLLGGLSHLPGGAITFTPPRLNAGLGEINTTSANVNGILGGWATISSSAQVVNGIPVGTNWASVDAGGNIVPYTNFTVYSSGTISAIAGPQNNIIFNTSGGPGSSVHVDVDHAPGAGTTTDINTLTINAQPRFGINIGSNNTLRLGRFGGIFLATVPSTADNSYELGNGTDPGNNPGANAGQNVGTLTAGGAPDTDGELVFTVNSSSQTANGSIYTEVAITDNGSGKVSVVKTGPGPMKFRGHNSFSGNMYILQGRIQMAGSELPGGAAITANPDAFGTGDIYVLPGGQAFPSGAGGNATQPAITNNWFLAGNGVSDNVGAIRFPNAGIFSNAVMTLIGDTRLGGGVFATGLGGRIYNKITGAFNLDFGATGNSGAGANGAILYNPENDWTGNTAIVGRTGSAGNTRLMLGNHNVIPDGFGKGNLILGNNGNNNNSECRLDLNGFNETVNGLASFVGNESIQFIENRNSGTNSILTVGGNDQSAAFGGTILDAGGILGLTKIGGGRQTLYGANSYSGPTTVSGGTLALSGAGSIGSSQSILVQNGAALDVSELGSDFVIGSSLGMTNGTLVVGSVNVNAPGLNLTNSQLTVALDPARINVTTTTLTNGGSTNLINISAVLNITAYPVSFTVLDYSGAIGGSGNNFGIGSVPNTNTVGFITNDTANSRIVVVLLDGPKPLTWTGTDPVHSTFWDVGTTTNWLAFKGTGNQTPADFNTADFALFDDTGSTNNVHVATLVEPGGMTVNNSTLNYTFSGPGLITGPGSLVKQGAGTLTLANLGSSDFRGAIAIDGGTTIFATDNGLSGRLTIASGATAQVGTNGGNGTLPTGVVTNEGSLVFLRGANLTARNAIHGAGSLTKNDAAVLTLGGVSTFTGPVTVTQGTLRVDNNSALGSVDAGTTVNNGATLDVGGPSFAVNTANLGGEAIVASGEGVGNNGAIINSSTIGQQDALQSVTLSNHTSFGGSGRWDIRGGVATLSTGGNPFNLTKVGTNQVSLVGVTVDAALANINVSSGTLAVETTTTLGNPASTLTVAAGATLQFFNTTTPFDKRFVLNGNGTTTTLNIEEGDEDTENNIVGPVSLNGAVIVNFSEGDERAALQGILSGTGGLTKTGPAGSRLILAGTNSYAGNTTNRGGTLVINGLNNGGGALTNLAGATLAGRGTHTGAVGSRGTIVPGDSAGTLGTGPLTLDNAQILFELGTNDVNQVFPVNDLISVAGNLTLNGVTTNRLIPGPIGVLTNGQIITLIQYTGTLTGGSNNFTLVFPPGYAFTLLDPATTPNAIRVRVDATPATVNWRGLAAVNPSAWDIGTTLNWLDGATPSDFRNGDAAVFNDQGLTNRVDLVGTLQPDSITMNNSALTYTFTGIGSVTGTSLSLNNGGTLILANSSGNNFSRGVTINSGVLQVGNGGTAGNLGAGNVTNNATLVFNRSDTHTNSNIITGSGTLSNTGPGVLVLSGANTYDGFTTVAQGTLRVANNTALGSANGPTLITSGATLDLGSLAANALNVGLEPINVIGAGVGGLGAIINSTTIAQQNALQVVTLDGHTTFGGTGRWDIRGAGAALNTSGMPYNLTKIGTNQVTLVGAFVDAALANINVQSGIFAVETTTTGLGNPTNTLTVAAGATLQFFNSVTPFDKIFVLNGNGTTTTLNGEEGDEDTENNIIGPVTLNGDVIVRLSEGDERMALQGLVSGTGSLTKIGPTGSRLFLSGTNTYTGNTTVNGGTLLLSQAGGLSNSAVITIAADATLDVTGLAAGPTLVLNSGQTLAGNGSVNGALNALPGSTVSPGTSIGVLTVTNNVTLQGTTTMELNASANTNDAIRSATGSITYGGTLNLVNVGAPLPGGSSYKLFNAASYFGSFTLNPPAPGPGQTWDTSTLNTDGTLRVVGNPPATTRPVIVSATRFGSDLVISGTNGTASGQYYVLLGTNILQPLTTWERIATNNFVNGNFNFTNTVDLNVAQRYYQLQLP